MRSSNLPLAPELGPQQCPALGGSLCYTHMRPRRFTLCSLGTLLSPAHPCVSIPGIPGIPSPADHRQEDVNSSRSWEGELRKKPSSLCDLLIGESGQVQTCDTFPSYVPAVWHRMYQGCLDTWLTPRMPEVLGWENSFFSKIFTQTSHHLCGFFFPNPSLTPSLPLFSVGWASHRLLLTEILCGIGELLPAWELGVLLAESIESSK